MKIYRLLVICWLQTSIYVVAFFFFFSFAGLLLVPLFTRLAQFVLHIVSMSIMYVSLYADDDDDELAQ